MAAGQPMAILVLPTSTFVEQQRAALAALAPDEQIYTDPATAPADEIEALLAFRLEAGIAPRLNALRFIACAGAGVDDLLAVADVPRHIPVVRAVDKLQGQRMAQYVALFVLRFHRDLPRLEQQHRKATWQRLVPVPEEDCTVGVMGFGNIGAPVVDILTRMAFPVAVWTRSPREIGHAETFSGPEGLAPFLARSRVLVCALPLTPATLGLVDGAALALLPRGAHVINVSRGAVVREADLVAAVDAGHLAGATLDVFETEPLPQTSPLWRHPKILCTPHIAATPRADVAAQQFLDNLHRARAGKPLAHVVDRTLGY
jgi:phosphoglycerate dehydrogenase-like enzyme